MSDHSAETNTTTLQPAPHTEGHEHGAVPEWVGGIFGLLLVSAAALAFCKKIKIPFTLVLVLIGIALINLVKGFWIIPKMTFLEPLAKLSDAGPEIILYVFLPTLIFESAYHLQARELRKNLVPILLLAIPGLLLSTLIIAAIVHFATAAFMDPIPFKYALVLGAILSATDPVAVISLFKQLGAPKRLTILVEGESLFNDATAIVVSKILVFVAVAGALTPGQVVGNGVGSFLFTFFGGLIVGFVLAGIVGLLLGIVEGDVLIEVSLTTILAYGSFVIGEYYLHVSGVMAVVAAAITIGSWGQTKISPSVLHHLAEFWEFLAYIANCLIFLLVGLQVDLGALVGAAPILLWVLIGMLISRAIVIFGSGPIVGKISTPIDIRYQSVMYWGGLRGAIALAIALELPIMAQDSQAEHSPATTAAIATAVAERTTAQNELVQAAVAADTRISDFSDFAKDTVVPLVMGAVLFTLIIPGLTIEILVKKLRLDVPPLADRLARITGLISANRRALERIPELQHGGLFSPRIANKKKAKCEEMINKLQSELESLRNQEMDHDQERRLLFLRAFATESSRYYEMYGKGHLTEAAHRDLSYLVSQLGEALRDENAIPAKGGDVLHIHRFTDFVIEKMSWIPMAPRLQAARTALDYEIQWGRQQATEHVIEAFDELLQTGAADAELVNEVIDLYKSWLEAATSQIDTTAEQFPEFVSAMQEQLADRLIVHAQSEAIEEEAESGAIPHGVAHHMQDEFGREIRHLRDIPTATLQIDPHELLRRVPFFADVEASEVERIIGLLREHNAAAGEDIIKQGAIGYSLYLIARGVVRISREENGVSRDLGTLYAGDFFGEIALLNSEPRTATCRAITPCSVFRLRKADLEEIANSCPKILEELRQAGEERKKNTAQQMKNSDK